MFSSNGYFNLLMEMSISELKDFCTFLLKTIRNKKVKKHVEDFVQSDYTSDDLLKITELDLSGYKLKSIPKTITCLKNLSELKLVGCKLEDLPTEIELLLNLRRIDLQGNNFTSVPLCLMNLPRLKTLYLSNNPYLKKLPIKLINQIKEPLPGYAIWIE